MEDVAIFIETVSAIVYEASEHISYMEMAEALMAIAGIITLGEEVDGHDLAEIATNAFIEGRNISEE